MTGTNFPPLLVDFFYLTVECLTVPLWYKQQVTFLNPKFNQIPMEIANFLLLFGPYNPQNVLGIVQLRTIVILYDHHCIAGFTIH